MKNITYYVLLLIIIVIILPFMIVRGCSSNYIQEIEEEEEKIIDQESEKIKFFNVKTGEVQEAGLEEYIRGVLAAEMPANFQLEALKAQAVAARTYFWGRYKGIYRASEDRHDDVCICTDPTHCQAWISKEDAFKAWGALSARGNWEKITRAIRETKGIIITYNNVVANPFYHSNSGGRTENIEDVWGGKAVPYLKSVVSYGEEVASVYKKTISMKEKEFVEKLKEKYDDLEFDKKEFMDNIEPLSYTQGGRVSTIRIGNKILKGNDMRSIFSLNSTNFKIEDKKGTIYITTLGYGHGVGMSQWGANYLAKEGMDFENILKYYYTGVALSYLSDME